MERTAEDDRAAAQLGKLALETPPAPPAPPPPAPAPPAPSEWIPLLNGRDLSGWEIFRGHPRLEGASVLVDGTSELAFPVPEADFEVQGAIRPLTRAADGTSHIGVLSFRRPGRTRTGNHLIFFADGDIHLHEKAAGTGKAGNDTLPLGEWSRLAIRLRQETITLEVDGRVVLRGTVPEREAGYFALFGAAPGASFAVRELAWRPLR